MQAEMIELLCRKGKFPTVEALVLAEAIDMAIEDKQFVTVPILDTRIAVLNGRFDAAQALVDGRFAAVNARFDALEAKIDAKLQRWAILIIVAVFMGQTALGPMGMSALDTIRRVFSTVVH